MSNEQKLREALLSDMDIAVLRMPVRMAFAGDMAQFQYHNRVQALLNRIEALALPTADHLPDAGKMVVDHFPDATKMIETAAPVGEHEAFERTMMDKYGWQRNDFKLDDFGYFDGHTDTAWMAWQARSALSASDAVDAQRYRWLREQHWSNSDICCVNKPKQNVRLGGICPSGDLLDAAIDAAMRKGQL